MTPLADHWIKILKLSRIGKTVVRSVQSTHFGRKILGCTPIAFALVKCNGAGSLGASNTENLSPENCIKQACLLAVNSASTLLTTTTSAILDVCKNYQNSLQKILFLLEEVKTTEGENPELWDAVVEARVHVNTGKAALNELNSYMETVEKVVTSTTEAAFLARAEYVCTALCERLDNAQKEINNQINSLKKLEEEYLLMQQEIVKKKEKEKKSDSKKSNEVKSDKNKNKILDLFS